MRDTSSAFGQHLYDNHAEYKETSITQRYIKPEKLASVLNHVERHSSFRVAKIGRSIQGREISMVKAGTGKIKILLWSQMHGDESTATMAMLDCFNFLLAGKSDFSGYILKATSLYFIPILNPDGAALFKRENAFNIDINRDALRLQTPEAKILKEVYDSVKPDFCFNLHDQSRYYSVGGLGRPAAITFLAPPSNPERTVNPAREKAMQVILHLNQVLQHFIPDQIARFSDEYEPRAFGDNFQKWGSSTILVESGSVKDDPEKQEVRKLTFVAMLSGIHCIATDSHKKREVSDYEKIPENKQNLYDLIIRNVLLYKNGMVCKVDIGINKKEEIDIASESFNVTSSVEEIGDLSTWHGYEEINADGMELESGEGVPVDALAGDHHYAVTLTLAGRADFVLKKAGEIRVSVINGFPYEH